MQTYQPALPLDQALPVQVNQALKQALAVVAAQLGATPSDVVRQCLYGYLPQLDPGFRELYDNLEAAERQRLIAELVAQGALP